MFVLVTQNNSRIFTQSHAKNICTNQEFDKQAILHMKDNVSNRMQNGEVQNPSYIGIEESAFNAKPALLASGATRIGAIASAKIVTGEEMVSPSTI